MKFHEFSSETKYTRTTMSSATTDVYTPKIRFGINALLNRLSGRCLEYPTVKYKNQHLKEHLQEYLKCENYLENFV